MSLMLKITNVFKNIRAKGMRNKSKSRIGVENRSRELKSRIRVEN
jgi:hypothetical protein